MRIDLPGCLSTISIFNMSTLAEIEAAVPALSAEELDRLEARLMEERRQRASANRRAPSNLTEFAGSVRLTGDPLVIQQQMREEWG